MDFHGFRQVQGFLMSLKKKGGDLLSGYDEGHLGFI